MRILSLETTETLGSVAALDGGRLLAEAGLAPGQRTAQSLVPSMGELMRSVGWRSRDVQLITLTIGPGSFTGLRAGVTAAKTFAYATGAEVLGVNTLEVIANQAPAEARSVNVALDAQRQQVFSARYARDPTGAWKAESEVAIIDQDAWLASLTSSEPATGPVLAKLASLLPKSATALPPDTWRPQARTVGSVAWRHYQSGRRDSLWQLVPLYLRKSAAEEKWDAKQKGK